MSNYISNERSINGADQVHVVTRDRTQLLMYSVLPLDYSQTPNLRRISQWYYKQ